MTSVAPIAGRLRQTVRAKVTTLGEIESELALSDVKAAEKHVVVARNTTR
jgi:hypothetical protein